MEDTNNELIDGGSKVDFYEADTGESAAMFSAQAQRDKFLGGSASSETAKDNAMKENKAVLPSLDQVKAHVLRWANPNIGKQYADAVQSLYRAEEIETPDGKRTNMVRTGIMDLTHSVQGTEQKIHNIGTAHDKNPQSGMNVILRKRVQDYIEQTPPEQRHFMLEGWNAPEGQELPKEYRDLLDSFKQQEGETEEEAYNRVVQRVGEQGIGLFYAMKLGIPVDFHTEISQEKEIEAFKAAGLAEADIAAFLLPKYLDIYKQGNEFKPEDHFTQQQMFEAISRVAKVTGWKKDELETLSLEQQTDFIAQTIIEANQVTQREIGRDILSGDYRTQYRFANELASYRDRSQVASTMFSVGIDTRDVHVAERAYIAVQDGKSPFLIFGDSHTYKIDPALAYLSSQAKAA